MPDDPQDAEVASQYKKDRKTWEATAKYWTQTYAQPRAAPAPAASAASAGGGAGAAAAARPAEPPLSAEEKGKLDQLLAMGFEREAALRALRVKTGNLEAAIEYLFQTT